MTDLLFFLQSISPLPDGLAGHLQQVVKRKPMTPKEHLLLAGQVCRHACFIESGLLRGYTIQHGKEVCSWFMKEQDICVSVESFFRQQPGTEYIQALEKTVVYLIRYEELQQVFEKFPSFNVTARLLTEKYYLMSEQRLSAMRLRRAPERYHWLSEKYPDLLQRVSGKYLASYLGISEVMLSNIRSRRWQ